MLRQKVLGMVLGLLYEVEWSKPRGRAGRGVAKGAAMEGERGAFCSRLAGDEVVMEVV